MKHTTVSAATVGQLAFCRLGQNLSPVIVSNDFLVSEIGVCESSTVLKRHRYNSVCRDVTAIRKGHGSIPTAHNRHDELFSFFPQAAILMCAECRVLIDVQTRHWGEGARSRLFDSPLVRLSAHLSGYLSECLSLFIFVREASIQPSATRSIHGQCTQLMVPHFSWRKKQNPTQLILLLSPTLYSSHHWSVVTGRDVNSITQTLGADINLYVIKLTGG